MSGEADYFCLFSLSLSLSLLKNRLDLFPPPPPPPLPRPLRRRPRCHRPLRRRGQHRKAPESPEARERSGSSSERWRRSSSNSSSSFNLSLLQLLGPRLPPPFLDPSRRDRARRRPRGQVGRQGHPVAQTGQRLHPFDASKPAEKDERGRGGSGEEERFLFLLDCSSAERLGGGKGRVQRHAAQVPRDNHGHGVLGGAVGKRERKREFLLSFVFSLSPSRLLLPLLPSQFNSSPPPARPSSRPSPGAAVEA